jgi:anti-sigma regulatory factor (Ser/Thr protein kinase)
MRFTVRLPHDPDSIPEARRALGRLEGEVDDLTLRNTRLLVSELVTNSVRHVPAGEGDTIELVVDRAPAHVRVEVADRGPGFRHVPRTDGRDASSGWGLHILSRLARRWGVEDEDGARVWFELDAPAL